MTTSANSAAQTKAAMRRAVLAQRRAAHIARGPQAAKDLAQRVKFEIDAAGARMPGNKIAGYWPLGDEIDPRPAMETLLAAGVEIGLPVVAGQGQVLIFRSWKPGDALDTGPFGTQHPTPRAALVAPQIFLIPMIAFDKTGHRLGYGAGYYDRTVAALRREKAILTVGIGYDEQEVEAVPVDPHDQRMDAVITDRRTIWFNETGKAPAGPPGQ